jgi:hypothetical protein
MFTQTKPTLDPAATAKRLLPEDTDYLGKGRVGACCARHRYHLRPNADEMDELMNHAASVYWHYLEVQQAHPAKAFVAARDRSGTHYFRKMCDFQRNCRKSLGSCLPFSGVTVEDLDAKPLFFCQTAAHERPGTRSEAGPHHGDGSAMSDHPRDGAPRSGSVRAVWNEANLRSFVVVQGRFSFLPVLSPQPLAEPQPDPESP